MKARLKAVHQSVVVILATAYRRILLRRVVFVGVTGSCAKSTTKELIAVVLGRSSRVYQSPRSENQPFPLAKVILGVPPWAGYCVLELTPAGMKERLIFEQPLRLAKPQIGVVTNIGDDHISIFGSRDAIAEEKGKLIAALPEDGVAILNADDVRVLGMRSRFAGRTLTYGLAPEATVRAEDVRGNWPERLSFTVVHGGQSERIQTQLCGTHWVHSVLAAVAVGITAGIPLSAVAQALQGIEPFVRRLSPVECNGITFVRDDWKAPLWTIPPAFDFMRQATAKRTVIVLGAISDYGNSNRLSRRIYPSLAAHALDSADRVVFVGPQASSCLKARRNPDDDALQAFYSMEDAVAHLREFLRPGDLVLLKGSRLQDNFQMVIDAVSKASPEHSDVEPSKTARTGPARAIHIVVGLGNTGEEYWEARHNVGQRVVDSVAQSLGVDDDWEPTEHGLIAVGKWHDETVYLLKPRTNVNDTGPVLRQLADSLGVGSADCLLVHDDIRLPLGTIRTRMGGRDGGHRGVRSVHHAFGTNEMPRVKIGVGTPEQGEQLADFVLKPFSQAESAIVTASRPHAAASVLATVALRAKSGQEPLDRGEHADRLQKHPITAI